MRLRVLIYAVLLFCQLPLIAQFKIGVYSGSTAAGHDVSEIQTQTGANLLIHEMRNDYASQLSGYSELIPANCTSSADVIMHNTGAYYYLWEAESTPDINGVGIRHDYGTLSSDGTSWCTENINSAMPNSSYLLKGPNYAQDSKYRFNYQVGNTRDTVNNGYFVEYSMNVWLKKGTTPKGFGSSSALCTLYVVSNNSVIGQRVVSINEVSSSSFTQITFDYNYSPAAAQGGAGFIGLVAPKSAKRTTVDTNKLFEFRIAWVGNVDLYVDKYTIFDNNIAYQLFISDSTGTKTAISSYVNSVLPGTTKNKIKYWYSYDEPIAFENFTSYRKVNTILQNPPVSSVGLITAFNTLNPFSNSFSGSTTIPRWITETHPNKFMFDFYPINYVVISRNHSTASVVDQLNVLTEICSAAHANAPGFYYIGQASKFYDEKQSWANLLKPTPAEFNAAAMIALAHGAKGLVFYPYYSSFALNKDNPSDTTQLTEGMIDVHGNVTPLRGQFITLVNRF